MDKKDKQLEDLTKAVHALRKTMVGIQKSFNECARSITIAMQKAEEGYKEAQIQKDKNAFYNNEEQTSEIIKYYQDRDLPMVNREAEIGIDYGENIDQTVESESTVIVTATGSTTTEIRKFYTDGKVTKVLEIITNNLNGEIISNTDVTADYL